MKEKWAMPKENERWGIIYSPKAGVRRTHKRWERIRAYLEEKQVAFDFVQSEGTGSVERLARMLLDNGYRMLVVVGGDAALNEALNGILNAGGGIPENLVLGVIPNGFGNNFAHFWGIREEDYRQAVDYLIRCRTRKVDVGLCRYQKDGQEQCRYFLNAVNIGLGASIIGITDEARRYIGVKFFAHLATSFRLIFERKLYKVAARINYEEFEENVIAVCVGSANGYGQTPNAVPYNGMLDVSVVTLSKDVRQLAYGIWLLMIGKFLSYRKVRPYRTREVEILRADHARISVDGRLFKGISAPLSVSIQQELLSFVIPSKD